MCALESSLEEGMKLGNQLGYSGKEAFERKVSVRESRCCCLLIVMKRYSASQREGELSLLYSHEGRDMIPYGTRSISGYNVTGRIAPGL